MASEDMIKRVERAKECIAKFGDKEDYYEALYEYAKYILLTEKDEIYAMEVFKLAKESIERFVAKSTKASIWALDRYCKLNNVSYAILNRYYDILLFEAQHRNFDSYMLYLERKREPKVQFYLPKRKQLMNLGLIQAMQEVLDGKLDILTISMPPGTGKTTLNRFFMTGFIGWFPEKYNLFWSHSDAITRMYYDDAKNILTSDDYCWGEIFPDCKITSTNAKDQQININKHKAYPNLQTTTNNSNNAGVVRANGILLVDDMISSIAEAINKSRLDTLWSTYSVDAKQRKKEGCVEVHVATRWSVNDVIGRIQRLYENEPGAERRKFISVPDIDEDTGKSNFDYDFEGFSVEFFADQELAMDEVSYKCLFKNQPIEREGLLYHEDELRRFFSLPEREPDAIVGVCDTKSKGIDFMVLPVFYQYDNDFYLVDCICDNSSDFEHQYSKITQMIIDHKMQQCEFESNAGGDRIAYEVEQRLRALGSHCNITTKATESNKETRIIVNSDFVIKNCLFRANEKIERKTDYDMFLKQMLTYSIAGKNEHDDVPDALANFSLYIQNKERIRPMQIIRGII